MLLLKQQVIKRFILRDKYYEYWHLRRVHPSESSDDTYAALVRTAIELYAFMASYQDLERYQIGGKDDPESFLYMAQPPVVMDAGPGIIDTYIEILTDENFFHSPQVYQL